MTLYVRIGVLAAFTAGLGAALPRMVATRDRVHEISIVARNMTYYAEGAADPNPVLRLAPGEQVRISFRNDDRGMSHDFVIAAFGVRTGLVEFGTDKSVTFNVPDTAAAATYSCTPHAAMMSGRIIFAK
jgi:plastocyanin